MAEDSPRASLSRFLELCRSARYGEAAAYLDLPLARHKDGEELARRLKAVLDRRFWVDLERLASVPEGHLDDHLPAGTDELTQLRGPEGQLEPVRLVRRRGAEARWIFSRATVKRIDSWYEGLEHRWALEHLPALLLRPGPRELLYWQWMVLPFLLLFAWLLGGLLSRLTRRVLARVVVRTATQWDDEVLSRIGTPLSFAWAVVVAQLLLPWLALYEPAEAFVQRLLRGVLFVIVFWALARAIDVARQVVATSPWAREHSASRSLVPLGARVVKVVVLSIAVVAFLSELGYPVGSLIAGLGIGGLAFALAAQKTVENLFGAFSIGADQPFREGDVVRIEDQVGTVESIGLRSTRIRSLDRTLISIPNGKLAEMRLESFSARDRLRLHCVLCLTYGTSTSQLRKVLADLEAVLQAHPQIWPDGLTVRFKEFGDSSLHIEVMAWFKTADWNEFTLIRQAMLLQFMDVIEQAGCGFAFPTRTVHLVQEGHVN